MEASEILQKIGLSKGESRVYLKLLELGEAKTGLLSDKAKVSRSKIYEILEKLKEKGLASSVIKENIAYFSAGSPENLKDYIEKRKKDVLDDEKELSDIMPQLLGLNNLKKEKQNSLVYEGYKGIKVVFNQILDELKKNQEYYAFAASEESYDDEFSLFISNYHKKREEEGIKVKLLSYINLKDKIKKDLGRYGRMELRFTSEKFPSSTIIFNNKVFIFTWRNPTAIVIQSQEIAKQYKEFFLDLWKGAKR